TAPRDSALSDDKAKLAKLTALLDVVDAGAETWVNSAARRRSFRAVSHDCPAAHAPLSQRPLPRFRRRPRSGDVAGGRRRFSQVPPAYGRAAARRKSSPGRAAAHRPDDGVARGGVARCDPTPSGRHLGRSRLVNTYEDTGRLDKAEPLLRELLTQERKKAG